MNIKAFYAGKSFDSYKYLGCHVVEHGAIFRTYAPNASRVTIIGEFNGWQETEMYRCEDQNFWECHIYHAYAGMMYKYKIYDKYGNCTEHCDPYGYGMELRPNWASIIRNESLYEFHDQTWMKRRSVGKGKAINIYEMHLGSWIKNNSRFHGWFTYREIAEELSNYLAENGYNYVEIMPVQEHPLDNSWGYQGTGYFSPTSRYGTMDDLKYFVDLMHQRDIGVILDFVPVHFAVDWYGLARYDGEPLYEYPYQDIEYSEWGSKNFNHARGEVRSFLQSSANYWISEYHFDGIRIDALSNIIYWQGNRDRGENTAAVEFVKNMNRGLKRLHPSVMLIAEDSTAYPYVTKPVKEGGLGFDYKWDMGWMHDTLEYFCLPPEKRTEHYHKLTFSMYYFYAEQFLLPFSHDEVVHGKGTIIQKMHGEYEEKFAQARALYMYMYAHPGKKLNFMGNEIAHFREWDERREQDWNLLEFQKHREFMSFMRDLNKYYLKTSAFSKYDYDREGFLWLDCHQEDKCVYVFKRMARKQTVIAAFNFSNEIKEYDLHLDDSFVSLMTRFSSDWDIYGGAHEKKMQKVLPDAYGVVRLSLAPYSGVFYETKRKN